MMTVFKALKKIGYGAIAKTTVKGHLKGSWKTAAILNLEVKMTVSRKCLYINNLAKKLQEMHKVTVFSHKKTLY